jgi:hypothetical protein
MWMYLILGFRPIQNLMGTLKINLDGIKLSKYVFVSKEQFKSNIGRVA